MEKLKSSYVFSELAGNSSKPDVFSSLDSEESKKKIAAGFGIVS